MANVKCRSSLKTSALKSKMPRDALSLSQISLGPMTTGTKNRGSLSYNQQTYIQIRNNCQFFSLIHGRDDPLRPGLVAAGLRPPDSCGIPADGGKYLKKLAGQDSNLRPSAARINCGALHAIPSWFRTQTPITKSLGSFSGKRSSSPNPNYLPGTKPIFTQFTYRLNLKVIVAA